MHTFFAIYLRLLECYQLQAATLSRLEKGFFFQFGFYVSA
jgi:hypothetical protein